MTPTGREILQGRQPITFRRDRAARAALAAVSGKAKRIELDREASQLFAMLKAERAHLAKKQNLPAFTIFTDETLAAIAVARPRGFEQDHVV